MTPHWECAEPELVTAYRLISKILSNNDFYLAGGSALALQEGHRISIDLDFMSATFADPESLIQTLRDSDLDFEVTMTSSRTVYISTGGSRSASSNMTILNSRRSFNPEPCVRRLRVNTVPGGIGMRGSPRSRR